MSATIDRRTFLKGAGAAGVAASLLGSRVARGATEQAPLRVLLVALQHGWGRDPAFGSVFSGSEFDFTVPDPIKGLDSIREHCVFVDGARGTLWGNAHDVSYSDIFTAAVPWGEDRSHQLGFPFPEPTGPSLDYLIAKHHASQVLRVSAGYTSWGRRFHPLCFNDRSRMLGQFTTPESAYDAIIAPILKAGGPPEPSRDALRDRLFDHMRRDNDRMLARMRGAEKRNLEGYVQAFTNLGRRLQSREPIVLAPDQIPDRPMPSPGFSRSVDDYLAMIKLVFQADTHRVAVLGFGEGIGDWSWRDQSGKVRQGNPWNNGENFHHYVAHHGEAHEETENAREAYEGWVDWYIKKIVGFVRSLEATMDVDGKPLIDNTLIMLTGEVGTGNHDTRRKLHVLIGGGDRLRRGRWIESPTIDPRARDGVFIGGERRDGERVESGINWGEHLSVWHTADVLAEVGRLAGVPLPDGIGLAANNLSPVPFRLT